MTKPLSVLVACEFSGRVRDAFNRLGHKAVSCDLLPSQAPGPHIQGDVTLLLKKQWDIIIAHPPCTYLCNSGVRWLYRSDKTKDTDRWKKMREAAKFFNMFLDSTCKRVCVENPVMHGYAQAIVRYPFTQSVQPWQFGDGEIKRTCLWLTDLPPLTPTNIVEGRVASVHKMAPSKDRWMKRSLTYLGIAAAMAEQWGGRVK